MNTPIALTIVATLWFSALATLLIGRQRPATGVAVARGTGALATLLSVVLAIQASTAGIEVEHGWMTVDRLGAGITMFATLMAAIVGTFASRSLAADGRAARFFGATNLLTGSTVLLAVADQPWVMAAGWVAVSISTVALIAFDGRPGALQAARHAAKVFAVGDIALITGVLLASAGASSQGIAAVAAELGDSGGGLPVLTGVLLTLAVLARSAQLPFSGWLAASVASPTPVSAMLHAGVVNGSAILLIRWQPMLAASVAVTALMVALGTAGILVGMAVGRTRPDVKSGLAWTTVAQMGFMIVQAAVGLVGPAVVHLMAHGFFKSSLFLGAGSALDGPDGHRHPVRTRPSVAMASSATAVSGLIVGIGLVIVRPEFLHHPAGFLPVVFSAATIAYGLVQWWTREPAVTTQRHRLTPIPGVLVGFTVLTATSAAVDGWLTGGGAAIAPIGAAWFAAAMILTVGTVALGAGEVAKRNPAVGDGVWMLVAAAAAPSAGALRRAVRLTTPADHHAPSIADATRRERIRRTITHAAADIAPSWPLERFVATNPLLASEHLTVEDATERAALDLGVRAELDEAAYRTLFDQGRISPDELRSAAADHVSAGNRSAGNRSAGNRSAGNLEYDLAEAGARDAIDAMVADLMTAPPQQLPGQRPVLLSEWHDRYSGTRWADSVDELSAWWCAALLSDHPAVPMPGRGNGLYSAWRSLVGADPRPERQIGAAFGDVLAALPRRSDDAVMQLLVDLGVDRPDHVDYLQRHLHRMPGWTSAFLRTDGPLGDHLVDYLAIRLAYEAALLAPSDARRRARRAAAEYRASEHRLQPIDRIAIWRDAFERRYRDGLLSAIGSADLDTIEQADGPATPSTRPASQVVCCIDPRSEGLRRHLEAVGPHETVGFAGFFGMPLAITDMDADAPVASCPVIVEPQATIVETVTAGPEHRVAQHAAMHAAHDVFAATKRSTAAPFALAENFGWVSGFVAAARTLVPTRSAVAARSLRQRVMPDASTAMVPASDHWWSLDEQVTIAANILRTTGLHRNAARLVLLCGHASRHVNNLHRSALDCGACGGRSGANNARAAANLLNDPLVRAALINEGIVLPADTIFAAAVHDTTSDRVEVLDREQVPTSHWAALGSLECALALAGSRLAAERGATLPSTIGRTIGPRVVPVQHRGNDWAQVVPEWGLAGNAALIIGPRSLTATTDLQRRVFLHTYHAEDDHDGSILASILAGPLQVAHWISSQYRMSTIDPDRLGAGTKTAHNLVGGVGVIEGAGGDVRLGLPNESVQAAGVDVHEPMRLLVVIDADASAVDRALAATPAVAQLVDNGWIRLVARPDDVRTAASTWSIRQRNSGWSPWTPAAGVGEDADVRRTERYDTGEPVIVADRVHAPHLTPA